MAAISRGLVLASLLAISAYGQAPQLPTEISGIRFNSGQDIVPYFEGWIRNPDGTFDLVFGYFNRNWKEELAIPPGPNNSIFPGGAAVGAGPNAGQPTYFLPRRQRWIYRLHVPADFGKKEVTWTITANGRTEKAYGNLLPAQEITERIIRTNGTLDPGEGDTNEPPLIAVALSQTTRVANALRLSVSVSDDGLPKPRAPRAPRPTAPSTAGFGGQVDRSDSGSPKGLTVSWLQYGGPARATFENTGPIPVTNGQAGTTVRFSQPGTYLLRVTANDGALSATKDVTVTVTP